ncbi:hypothetical protein [Phenylobacterium sp.]|uniref:hypothetical protein n=1 Tax=Phenylobacterium sp. TaxID=1871053 RepID=UPI0035B122F5
MAPRLKVFVTSDGFTDYVVATSSRAKALAAWGARQDLFATGGAYETDDRTLIEAASAQPGEVLRRPRQIRPVKTPPPGARAKAREPDQSPRRKGPTPHQIARVKALEAQLTAEAAAYDAELESIADERATLDARRRKLEDDYLVARNRLREALRKAREALR